MFQSVERLVDESCFLISALLMLVVASGLGKEVKNILNHQNEGTTTRVENPVTERTVRKNGKIDVISISRFSADETAQNLTKSSLQLDVLNETHSLDFGEDKAFRVKRSLPDVNISSNDKIKPTDSKLDQLNYQEEVTNAIYAIVILTVIYLVDSGFDR